LPASERTATGYEPERETTGYEPERETTGYEPFETVKSGGARDLDHGVVDVLVDVHHFEPLCELVRLHVRDRLVQDLFQVGQFLVRVRYTVSWG